MMTFTGGCLCGAVRYECSAEPAFAGFCQCEDCRRSSGAGHGAHMGVADAALTVRGAVSEFARAADSGNVVTRCFCPTCGSAVFSRNAAMPGFTFLRASSLDDLEVFKPQMVVYTRRGASWDKVGAGLPRFEGMPPSA